MEKTAVQKRNARNRSAGASWETTTLASLRSLGFDSERLRLSGKQDEGDVVFRHEGHYYVLECKNVKTWGYAGLLGYVGEVVAEVVNFAKRRLLKSDKVHGAVLLKVHNKSWRSAVVMMPVTEYLDLVRGRE